MIDNQDIFLNGIQYYLPRNKCIVFSSYYPLNLSLRKAFLVLLVIDRNCNCGSLRVKPAYSAAELLQISESPK